MMCGYLAGMAVFGAKIRDLTPVGTAGKMQGVRICAQVLVPGIIGPFIGKTVLSNAETTVGNDGTVSFIPNQSIFLSALIVLLVLIGCPAAIFWTIIAIYIYSIYCKIVFITIF